MKIFFCVLDSNTRPEDSTASMVAQSLPNSDTSNIPLESTSPSAVPIGKIF